MRVQGLQNYCQVYNCFEKLTLNIDELDLLNKSEVLCAITYIVEILVQ